MDNQSIKDILESMKKMILAGIVALVAVAVLSYIFRIKGNTDDMVAANSNYEPIVLYVEGGIVRYKLPSQNNFVTAASSSVKIENMTTVETLEGNASVLLPDNSTIYIEKNSQIVINYAEKRTSIFQSFGTTYHRVEAVISGGTYQVQTPETLAAVRGTKFAVSYDKLLRRTKVSVTEHSVEVSDTKLASATNTPSSSNSKILKEGETGIIVAPSGTSSPSEGIAVIKTDSDSEMKVFVEKEKKKDVIFEKLKKDSKDMKDFRNELMESLSIESVGSNVREFNNIDPNKDVIPKTSDEVREEIIKPKAREGEVNKEPIAESPKKIIVKLSEEEFFTKFEALFVSYFYLDNDMHPCKTTLSPEERVRRINLLAEESGYPLPTTNLLSFSREIDVYCKTKDASLLEKLQKRFDEEYPY